MVLNLKQMRGYAKVVTDKQKQFNPESFTTNVAGVTFEGRERFLSKITRFTKLSLERDRTNKYDCYAVKLNALIEDRWVHVGFIPKTLSRHVSSLLDGGVDLEVNLESTSGFGDSAKTFEAKGLNIKIATI